MIFVSDLIDQVQKEKSLMIMVVDSEFWKGVLLYSFHEVVE